MDVAVLLPEKYSQEEVKTSNNRTSAKRWGSCIAQ
jgi:hypothetical protein